MQQTRKCLLGMMKQTFFSFESMTDRHWKNIKTFSKLGCVQDIFNFYINDELFYLKSEFLDMFYKQTCRFKINFSFEFILRNCSDKSFRYWHACNGVDRILDQTQLISNFFDFETFLNKVFEQDMLEKVLLSRPNGSYTPPRKTPSRNYISPKNTWPKLHNPEYTFP